MTQVRLMKDALEKSYTTFKWNLSALTKAIERESSSSRNLKVKLDSLTEALDSLDAAHTMWKSKADLTEDQLIESYATNGSTSTIPPDYMSTFYQYWC